MAEKIPESPSRLKNGMNPLTLPYKGKESMGNASSSSLYMKSRNSRIFTEISGSNSFPKINKLTNIKEINMKKDETKKLVSPINLRVNTEKFYNSKEDSNNNSNNNNSSSSNNNNSNSNSNSNMHRVSSNILSPAYRRSPLVYDSSFPYEKDNKLMKPLTSPINQTTNLYSLHNFHTVRPASPHTVRPASPHVLRPSSPHTSTAPTNKKPPILLNDDYDNFYENPVKFQRYSPTSTHLAGWLLLFTTYIVFVVSMYAVIFSKIMSNTGNP
eukprot:jgi/Orpsp1_1/1189658/evm.model.d7180000073532.1